MLMKGYFPIADNLITFGSSFSAYNIVLAINTVAVFAVKDIVTF